MDSNCMVTWYCGHCSYVPKSYGMWTRPRETSRSNHQPPNVQRIGSKDTIQSSNTSSTISHQRMKRSPPSPGPGRSPGAPPGIFSLTGQQLDLSHSPPSVCRRTAAPTARVSARTPGSPGVTLWLRGETLTSYEEVQLIGTYRK